MRVLSAIFLLIICSKSFSQNKKITFVRQITFQMQLKGDLLLKLDGSGPLGSEISLTTEPENANCQWKALIREFGTKLDENFEFFLSEKCMQPGSEIISKQIHFPKIVYSRKQPLKTHKFVDLSSEIKSVTAEIIDLQVMSPQKK